MPVELENTVMRLDEQCCFDSYTHALKDLQANGRIVYQKPFVVLRNKQ